MVKSALIVLVTQRTSSSSFNRYFQGNLTSLDIVCNVFSSFFQAKNINGEVTNNVFLQSLVSYDVPPTAPSTWLQCDFTSPSGGKLAAYMNHGGEYGGVLVICPGAFTELAFKVDLPMGNDDQGCDKIGDWATTAMWSLSYIVLHEYLHWNALVEIAIFPIWPATLRESHVAIADYNGLAAPPELRSSCLDPPDGYGVYNAQRLRKRAGDDVGLSFRVLRNVDSYTNFATEAYWALRCNKQFVDPPRAPDTQIGFVEGPDPPEIPLSEPEQCFLLDNWGYGVLSDIGIV